MSLNILLFVPVVRESYAGGVRSMSCDMACALNELGHKVILGLFERSGSLQMKVKENNDLNRPSWIFSSFRQKYILFHNWNWGYALKKVKTSLDAVIVVCGSPFNALPFFQTGLPVYVWSAVTLLEDLKGRMEEFSRSKLLAYRMALPTLLRQEKWALRRSVHVWALSEPTRRNFLAATRKSMAPTSLLFPPLRVSTPASPARFRKPLICFTGRCNDSRKNLPLLVRAMAKVRETVSDAKLLLIGGSRVSSPVEELVKQLNLDHMVEVIPLQPRKRLLEYLQNSRVFALASHQEGLCISALEAMACGTPVVSTRCGGPESYIVDGENGYLVPLDDADAMASRLTLLLTNQVLWENMSKKAVETVRTRFAPERFREEIENRLCDQT